MSDCGCPVIHRALTPDGETLTYERLEWAHDTTRRMPKPNMLDDPMMTERLYVLIGWSHRQ